MRSAPALIGFLALFLTSPSCGFAGIYKRPEWAGIPVAHVGGEKCPIVAYHGLHPIAIVGGVKKDVDRAPISMVPAKEFGPGMITMEDAQASSTTTYQGSSISNITQSLVVYGAFSAKLTSDIDLQDVYMILLVYEANNSGHYDELPRVSLQGTHVGTLAAGKRRTFSVNLPGLSSNRPLRWSALFFSNGAQIQTSMGNEVLDGLFDILDRHDLDRIVKERSSGNHRIEVYRRFPFTFSAAIKKEYAGKSVTADVTIAPSGTLDIVQIDGPGMKHLCDALVGQFAYWLFVPRIVNGQPVSTTIQFPMKF